MHHLVTAWLCSSYTLLRLSWGCSSLLRILLKNQATVRKIRENWKTFERVAPPIMSSHLSRLQHPKSPFIVGLIHVLLQFLILLLSPLCVNLHEIYIKPREREEESQEVAKVRRYKNKKNTSNPFFLKMDVKDLTLRQKHRRRMKSRQVRKCKYIFLPDASWLASLPTTMQDQERKKERKTHNFFDRNKRDEEEGDTSSSSQLLNCELKLYPTHNLASNITDRSRVESHRLFSTSLNIFYSFSCESKGESL